MKLKVEPILVTVYPGAGVRRFDTECKRLIETISRNSSVLYLYYTVRACGLYKILAIGDLVVPLCKASGQLQ